MSICSGMHVSLLANSGLNHYCISALPFICFITFINLCSTTFWICYNSLSLPLSSFCPHILDALSSLSHTIFTYLATFLCLPHVAVQHTFSSFLPHVFLTIIMYIYRHSGDGMDCRNSWGVGPGLGFNLCVAPLHLESSVLIFGC